ncbi:hypothetical protein FZ046_05680 [Mycolicibacterium grossiae]|nr:hypothetical protein FZ046_05680 [Mycolicibacterium grossiae]
MASTESNGWNEIRQTIGPAATWTEDQRTMMSGVAQAMRNGAEQVLPLAKRTPHRVMRELYEQFIAYGRAYAETIDTYTPSNNFLASTNVNAGRALMSVCDVIQYGATDRMLNVDALPPPDATATPEDLASPSRFLLEGNQICSEWLAQNDSFNNATGEWQAAASDVAAAQWTPERRALQESTLPKLSAYAKDIYSLGQRSANPVLKDFSSAASLYLQAYVTSGAAYVPSDSFLVASAFRFGNIVTSACEAAST